MSSRSIEHVEQPRLDGVPEHPAKFSRKILDVFREMLSAERDRVGHLRVLDPFAGCGGVHELAEERVETFGYEIQPEWAAAHADTICGNVLELGSVFPAGTFDAVATSPSYGNRLADHHEAKDPCRNPACDGGKVERAEGATPAEVDAGCELGVVFVDCPTCGGSGLSKRNTYAHYLRAAGAEPVKADNSALMQWGCLAPGHRVLRGDWRWVPVGSLSIGDPLVAFDEWIPDGTPSMRQRGRRWQPARVEAIERGVRECVEVAFDDGSVITCTTDHPWLGRHDRRANGVQSRVWRWIVSTDLQPGDRLGKFMEPWQDDRSYEAGWLAGMFDGEGSLSGNSLAISQKPGPVLDRVVATLDGLGIKFTVQPGTNAWSVSILGGVAARQRLLGSIRSERLTPKANMAGKPMQAIGERRVLSVTRVGEREVTLMGTSTGTYLAEGMGSHNTTYRRFHTEAWLAVDHALRRDGLVLLNVKNHHRGSKLIRVVEFHLNAFLAMGYSLEGAKRIDTRGMAHGANHEARTGFELILALRAPM